MKRLHLSVLLVVLTLILGASLTVAQQQSGDFELSSGQSFAFNSSQTFNQAKKDVTDLGFYVDSSFNMGILETTKIKYFGNSRPNIENITATQVEKWRSIAYVSMNGSYFVLKTAAADGYYLLKVETIKNGDLTSSKILKASWEKIEIKK